MLQVLEFRQIVRGQIKVLQIWKFGQPLNPKDIVVAQIDHFQLSEFLKVLYFFDHVILQKQVLQTNKTFQILYFNDHVIFKVQSLQIDILVDILYFLNNLEVQIDFVIHLWILVQTLVFTDYPQITLGHYHASIFASLQILRLMGHLLSKIL